jgi:hypothetical protein
MGWVLIPGALLRLRHRLKLSRAEAADKFGLTVETMRRHEHRTDAPRTLRDYIVRIYCKGYGVPPEAFVRWEGSGEGEKRGRKRKVKDPAAPKIQTLTERVEHELATSPDQTIQFDGRKFRVVGAKIMQECMTAFALHAGKTYAVSGIVSDSRALPERAAKMLNISNGVGASFRIDREIVAGLPLYVTVIAKTVEDTRFLLDRHQNKQPVTVLVRIFVKEAIEDWKGFFIFEKKPTPRPWIFLVDHVIGSTETSS